MAELMESIGERLRRLRERRGYSQEQLATLIGVPQSQISRWEAGRVPGENMQLGSAMRLAWVLGVSLDALSGMADLRI